MYSITLTDAVSQEKVVVPAPQQPKPNPLPNLTRQASTDSEHTHSPLPNNRSPRLAQGSNRRGNNSNYYHHYNNNNSRGGNRGRDRGGANWNPSWNNSSRPPHVYWVNQAMTTAPPPPPVSYGFGPPAVPSPIFAPTSYGNLSSQF
jgi:hypothetical protein